MKLCGFRLFDSRGSLEDVVANYTQLKSVKSVLWTDLGLGRKEGWAN